MPASANSPLSEPFSRFILHTTIAAPLPLLYRQTAIEDSLLSVNDILFRPSTETVESWGMYARPTPASPQRTDCITIAVLLCIPIIVFIRRTYRPHFREALSNFLFPTPDKDPHKPEGYQKKAAYVMTALFFCLQGAMLTFAYAQGQDLIPVTQSSWILFGSYFLMFLIFMLMKLSLYHVVHAVFFTNAQRQRWRNDYAFLFTAETLLLFPLLLLFIYLHLNLQISLYSLLFLLVFIKISLLFKCFSTFFHKIHGILHLFVYFCALEAAPLIILWAFLAGITNNLTIYS